MKKTLITLLASLGLAASSQAFVQLTPVSVTGNGTYNNSETLISDGFIPAEQTVWTAATNVWWTGLSPNFILDLGAVFLVREIVVSVDNNDAYLVSYSTDNAVWSPLFDIAPGDGNVAVSPGGMDTMSSYAPDLEYLGSLEFAAQNARYLRIEATGGDNLYSVGEVQVFGDALTGTSVPDSGSNALLALVGLLGLIGLRKRIRR